MQHDQRNEPAHFRSVPLIGTFLSMIGVAETRDQNGNSVRAHTVRCASGEQHRISRDEFPALHSFMLKSAFRDFRIDGTTEALGDLPSPMQRVCNGETLERFPER